jgi:hypothetical protein
VAVLSQGAQDHPRQLPNQLSRPPNEALHPTEQACGLEMGRGDVYSLV